MGCRSTPLVMPTYCHLREMSRRSTTTMATSRKVASSLRKSSSPLRLSCRPTLPKLRGLSLFRALYGNPSMPLAMGATAILTASSSCSTRPTCTPQRATLRVTFRGLRPGRIRPGPPPSRLPGSQEGQEEIQEDPAEEAPAEEGRKGRAETRDTNDPRRTLRRWRRRRSFVGGALKLFIFGHF